MIFEVLLGICKTILVSLISGLGFISLPFDVASFLGTVTNYGAFCVGGDIMLSFCTSVMFWLGVKISLGIFLFIWRLLPFT